MELMPLTDLHKNRERLQEVEVYDLEDRASVINRVPPSLKSMMVEREKGIKDYLELDEFEAKVTVEVTPTLNRLRFSFWNEYFSAVEGNRPMRTVAIYGGVCSKEQLLRILLTNNRFAWILRPPVDTVLAMRETLHYGLDRVREILSLPLYKEESIRISETEWKVQSVVNDKAANLMLKAVAMVDLRLHGNYTQVQKIDQSVTSKNINVNTSKTLQNIQEATYIDVDAEIEKLKDEVRGDIKKLTNPINAAEVRDLNKLGYDAACILTSRDAVTEAIYKDIEDRDGDMDITVDDMLDF